MKVKKTYVCCCLELGIGRRQSGCLESGTVCGSELGLGGGGGFSNDSLPDQCIVFSVIAIRLERRVAAPIRVEGTQRSSGTARIHALKGVK
jgi:hypothetical protein